MQPRTSMSAFTVTTAMFFGVAAMAADLPKEGTISGTWTGFNTIKATAIGKERLFGAVDINGLTLGNGILDHMTWHCSGLYDVTKGMALWNAFCAGTDPAGDQIVFNSDGKWPADAKSYSVTNTFTTGIGKYTGISGAFTILAHGPELRTPAEGTFTDYGEIKGSYKLP